MRRSSYLLTNAARFVEQLRVRDPDLARDLSGLLARDDEAERTHFLEPISVASLAGLELGGWTIERPLVTAAWEVSGWRIAATAGSRGAPPSSCST
jgi:hypothetical protein